MGRGIIGTVTLFGTVAIAATVVLMGVDFFLSGERATGLAFLGIAVLMVVAERYVMTPTDVAADAAKDVASAVVETPEDDEE